MEIGAVAIPGPSTGRTNAAYRTSDPLRARRPVALFSVDNGTLSSAVRGA